MLMVMPPLEHAALMTIDEFVNRYESQGPFELIHGELVQVSPGVFVHIYTIRTLFRLLDAWVTAHQLGDVFIEMPIVETYESNWVKGSLTPDILFVRAERMTSYKQSMGAYEGKPLVLIPDLAVEVISAGDSYDDVSEKVAIYLAKGVQLVWVVNPQRRRVDVHTAARVQRLGADDALSGGEVIPGFTVPVAALFE